MSDNYQNIELSIEDRTGRIRFMRPPLNVFNIAMMREINDAVNVCAGKHELVAIVFDAAEGSRAFSAGVAVEEHVEETVYQMLESFHSIFRTLEQAGKPAMALVDGAALGGGCELVAGCDIVIASDRSRFGQPEIKLGVFPPVAAILLPRIIGDKRARELMLTGDLIDAREALRLGLVNYVVAPAELEQKAQDVLVKLRELSAPALEATKRAIEIGYGARFNDALSEVENLYLNELMKTADAREGIKAFMEKRKPLWQNK